MLSSMSAFTLFHVALSLVGIVAGLLVMAGLLQSRHLSGWTALFLVTTAATTVTGFLFPFRGFTPALGVGVVSSVVLAATAYALYARRLAGRWRGTYVLGATVSLYLNVFVLVVPLFDKVPGLHAPAPTQPEPPFAIAQGIVLVLFVAVGFVAVRGFHPVELPVDAHAA